jgi:hypothetical protein
MKQIIMGHYRAELRAFPDWSCIWKPIARRRSQRNQHRESYNRLTPEQKLERSRGDAARIKADPEAYARRLATQREARKRRKQVDPTTRLKSSLRARMSKILKGRTSKALGAVLGCSGETLKQHLQAKFRDGMTWDNYGTHWHIDHIKPCSRFDHGDPKQIAECWHFTNLQPLTVYENCSKQDRWEG